MSSHLTLDLYKLVLRGHLSPRLLLEHGHRHLLEVCEPYRAELEVDPENLDSEAPAGPSFAAPPSAGPPPPDPTRRDSLRSLDHRLERWERVRYERRRARENLHHLREHPHDRWVPLVEDAQTRFRTRAFAELLVLESREVLPRDPAEARHLAALVPVVLRWLPGAEDQPWAVEIHLRAAARHAHALRAAGDPAAAREQLAHLRRRLPSLHLPEPHQRRVQADLDWTPDG